MQTRLRPILAAILLAALLLSACNLPGGGATAAPSQVAVDAIYTAAAQTLQAQLTQAAAQQPPAQPSDTPQPAVESPAPPANSPQSPAEQPSETPTPTPAATETPSATPTSAAPLISASTATNCRPGPGKVYEPIKGVLPVGIKVEVVGRNSNSTWWYIQNPGKAGDFCWVWGETTTVEGNAAALPVLTPPPPPPTATFTPTPGAGFSASFRLVHNCSGNPTAIFEVKNTGGAPLHSMELRIDDLTDSDTLFGPSSHDAPFMGSTGECPPGGDLLPAGKTLFIGGAIGGGNSGHQARARIKLCTQNGLGGSCIEKTIEFTIP
ncbi:MAG: hypothetical protein L0Z70_01465 [Chloroflexi bacterium]|nr:hypothetical protein [Chloroflexota bacterium]